MQASKFNQLIKNPFSTQKEDVAELQQLVKDFPYFQSAHILLNLAAKRWDTNVYEKNLKKTAILVSNRTHLFNLINAQEQAVLSKQGPMLKEPKNNESMVEKPMFEAAEGTKEEVQEELNILKATDVAHEQHVNQLQDKHLPEQIVEKEALESEIAKQVVASIVDKEIINAPNTPLIAEQANEAQNDFKPESFSDWLAYFKKNNGQPYNQIEKQVQDAKEQKLQAKLKDKEENNKTPIPDLGTRKQKNKALIDKIIDSNPGAIKIKEEQKFYQPDTKAKESLLENEHLVTETLAKIYALQGNTAKAIRAYQILSLKFPQKSVYFASLIQKLKNNE